MNVSVHTKAALKAPQSKRCRACVRSTSVAKRLDCGGFSAAFRADLEIGAPALQRGSILIGLLWCLVLLSLVVIGFLHTTRLDLQVGKHFGDRTQAHYLALAGVEKAKALLYRNARERSRSGKNHDGGLYNAADEFRNVTLGRGKFQIFRRGRTDEGSGVLYGIVDEESRLNVNTTPTEDLARITGMTPDVVAAIADWRDGDNAASPGGAEVEYYASLQPPYRPRNGAFQTVRELLMVRGVSRDLLFGNDSHHNDLLDVEEEENGAGAFVNEQINDTDLGWARLFTVSSSVKNVNAAGDDRVNVQSANETALTGLRGITPEIARAIVQYRGQNELRSIADLLEVTAPNPNQTTGGAGAGQGRTGGNQTNNAAGGGTGRRVISEDLFVDIADDVTVESNSDVPGLVNVNTASLDVLACLPGVDRQLAQSIISFRQSNGFLPNIGWLLKVPGLSRDVFKQLAPRVTARSETYRILCEGKVDSTGVRQRIQAVVHIGLNDVKLLAYREDDL